MANKRTAHKLVGPEKSIRKTEYMNYSNYNPTVKWGDWQLVQHKISGTEYIVDMDDLHFINNPAMQQMWDDIRRTIVVGLDMPHEVLEKKLGKEITPETINNYLEILHYTAGGTVVPEYVAEVHPGLIGDSDVKIFTGDDFLADEIDPQFLIDINKLFPVDQAENLKRAIGKTTWQVTHIPTIVVRTCGGASTVGWNLSQIWNSIMRSYNLCDGDHAALADIGYDITRQAIALNAASMVSPKGARGNDDPSGISFGFLADMVQSSRTEPHDPVKVSMNVVAAGAVLYDQILLGGYFSWGGGYTDIACAAYTNDILDDFCYYGVDFANHKFGGFAKAPKTIEVAKELATEVNAYGKEQYESFPTMLETHSDGSQRAFVLAAASGITAAIASGHSQVGFAGWYLSQLVHKEGWGRLGGSLGYDLQDQCGPANVWSYQSDEGNPLELRGANHPGYALDVGHMGGYAGIVSAAHAGRMDAFAVNPLVKIAFANPSLAFDWADIRTCIGKGAMREFHAKGERNLVMPTGP